MKGKYLITTDSWFTAPDGKEYKAVWGECEVISTKEALGFDPNRNSANWFVKVGNKNKHILVAGCQIHYAIKSEENPNQDRAESWTTEGGELREFKVPSRIYIAE